MCITHTHTHKLTYFWLFGCHSIEFVPIYIVDLPQQVSDGRALSVSVRLSVVRLLGRWIAGRRNVEYDHKKNSTRRRVHIIGTIHRTNYFLYTDLEVVYLIDAVPDGLPVAGYVTQVDDFQRHALAARLHQCLVHSAERAAAQQPVHGHASKIAAAAHGTAGCCGGVGGTRSRENPFGAAVGSVEHFRPADFRSSCDQERLPWTEVARARKTLSA